MAYEILTEGKGGTFAVQVTGETSTSGGGIASIANPWGQSVMILRATWYIDTASTGAANVDIGIGAAATTDATDILNALAANGSIAGKFYNGFAMQNSAKTEVTAPVLWTAAKFLNFTGSADTSGLVANLYLEVVPV